MGTMRGLYKKTVEKKKRSKKKKTDKSPEELYRQGMYDAIEGGYYFDHTDDSGNRVKNPELNTADSTAVRSKAIGDLKKYFLELDKKKVK